MVLSVSLGGKTFMLKISSDGSPTSLVSVEQSELTISEDDEPDTTVQLRNFSGTLHISRSTPKQEHIDNGKKNESFECITAQRPQQTIERTSSLVDQKTRRLSRGILKNIQEEEKQDFEHEYPKSDIEESLGPVHQETKSDEIRGDKRWPGATYSSGKKSSRPLVTFAMDSKESGMHSFASMISSRPSASSLSSDSETDSFLDDEEDEEIMSLDNESVDSSIKWSRKKRPLSKLLTKIAKQQNKSLRTATHLHSLCEKKNVKAKELIAYLRAAPSQAASRDKSGKLPLHLIAQNQEFIFGNKSRKVDFFIANLINAYPDAVFAVDDNGRIPFTSAISDWIQDIKSSGDEGKPNMSIVIDKAAIQHYDELRSSLQQEFTLKVEAPQIVRWSFSMLSHILESRGLEMSSNSSRYLSCMSNGTSQIVLDNVASLSDLLPSVLLIDNDIHAEQLTHLPIIQQVLLRKELVHDWLIVMLSSDGKPATRAVNYFEILSNLTTENAFGVPKLLPNDILKFHVMHNDMIEHIANLEWILPSLFCLNENEFCRACNTRAVQQILEISVVNRPLIRLMVLDLALHVLLLLAYEAHVTLVAYSYDVSSNFPFTPSILVLWICIYFFLRDDFSEKLMAKSWKRFFNRYLSFWNLIEILSVIFTFATTLSTQITKTIHSSAAVVITVGLIWMRLLGFLKGINKHLALFILSLTNIIKNMRWFLIVLCIGCAMFGHMLHTMAYIDRDELCAGVDSTTDSSVDGDHCTQHAFWSVIRAYSIIVGDIALDDYRESSFVTIMWVVFTLFGVIILLNVLIAIVTTSYVKSFSQRPGLLARARMPLLAKHYFLEAYLVPILRDPDSKMKRMRRYSIILLMASFFVVLEFSFLCFIGAWAFVPQSLSSTGVYLLLVLSSALVVIANIAIIQVWIIFFDWKATTNIGEDSMFGRCVSILFTKPMGKFVYSLLGIDRNHRHDHGQINIDHLTG